ILYLYEQRTALGGPIKRDKIWFFTTHRFAGNKTQVPGQFFNLTQGTPFYTPDLTRPGFTHERVNSHSGRMTWQVSPRNKVNAFAEIQSQCICRRTTTGNEAPEAMINWNRSPTGLLSISWNSPRSNRLLLEATAGMTVDNWPNDRQPGVTVDDIAILDVSTNRRYNAWWDGFGNGYGPKSGYKFGQRFGLSYVTGSHTLKTGVQIEQGVRDFSLEPNGARAYRFRGVTPIQIEQIAAPFREKETLKADLGIYVQDQWTVRRLTLNYGLRFDYFNSSVPEQHLPAGRWVPVRDFAPVDKVPEWKDWNRRLGASYDLFGTGRTALKVFVGRYPFGINASDIAAANNPVATSVNSVTRTWSDVNGNYMPDCDLTNTLQNGECGTVSDVAFGRNKLTTHWADNVLRGTGVRPYTWDVSAEVQHQLTSTISLTGGYYRNWAGNFRVTDNLLVTPADYDPFCITAPRDARLPGSGGYQVCGLYDIARTRFGQVDNLVTRASEYGEQKSTNDFVGVNVRTRFRSGLNLGGGIDTGRIVNDSCFTIDSPQQLLYCRVVT